MKFFILLSWLADLDCCELYGQTHFFCYRTIVLLSGVVTCYCYLCLEWQTFAKWCVLGYVHLTAKDRNLVFRILSLRKTILTTSKNSLRHLCFCKFFFRFLYPGLQLGLRRSPGINELVYFTHHVIRYIVKYFSYR